MPGITDGKQRFRTSRAIDALAAGRTGIMPEICRFYGISIRMFYDDHGPPHFHAIYGEHEAKIEIGTGSIRGHLPPRALRLVREWYPQHAVELLEDWRLAANRRPLNRIEPLE